MSVSYVPGSVAVRCWEYIILKEWQIKPTNEFVNSKWEGLLDYWIIRVKRDG